MVVVGLLEDFFSSLLPDYYACGEDVGRGAGFGEEAGDFGLYGIDEEAAADGGAGGDGGF